MQRWESHQWGIKCVEDGCKILLNTRGRDLPRGFQSSPNCDSKLHAVVSIADLWRCWFETRRDRTDTGKGWVMTEWRQQEKKQQWLTPNYWLLLTWLIRNPQPPGSTEGWKVLQSPTGCSPVDQQIPHRGWRTGKSLQSLIPPSPLLQNDDGTYTGFIKVHLKLRRPVTVPAGIRPQSIYDALKEVNLAEMTDKRTSFYLPLDAIKQLHISSTTTVSEVIQGLLKKFMVVDNPQKFALFKEMRKDGQGELAPSEPPAFLRLSSLTVLHWSVGLGLRGVSGRQCWNARWINGLSTTGDAAA